METTTPAEPRPAGEIVREPLEPAIVTRAPATRSLLSIWPVIREFDDTPP